LDTLTLVKNQSLLERRLAEAPAVRDLMDTWRGLHFILALVAIMFMFLHIALVLPFTRWSLVFGG
jgi:thiosulfate reductase cytochrome b subunit